MVRIESQLMNYLQDGVNQLKLNLTEIQSSQLMNYLNLLIKWNKVYSLTAITKPMEMIDNHLLDGMSVLNELTQIENLRRIVDVGSGMGVPGVILAICRPDLEISVLDSNQKKTSFLLQVKIELKLSNLHVINKRVEQVHDVELFDVVISRAFADVGLFLELSQHLVKPDGIILAMKGQKAFTEIAEINSSISNKYTTEIIELHVPHLDKQRYIAKLSLK